MSIDWRPTTEIPERGRPIVMCGPSGYNAPHDVAYFAGFYDDEFRPRMPWLTFSGDAITGHIEMPRFWAYREEIDRA